MSEETRSIIIEKYEFEDGVSFNVLGMKNTKDCCGVTFKEMIDEVRRQML